jgi:hypothetical protein
MNITDDMVGEYIYISNELMPPSVIYYKDKKIVKTEKLSSMKEYLQKIEKVLKLEGDEFFEYITNNSDDILEIVVNQNGVVKFSLGGINAK